jgi:hypothetical protein
VSVAAGKRVLLTGQTTGSQNGIWVVLTGDWVRPTDFQATGQVFSGLQVHVNEGTKNAESTWALRTEDPIVVDTTALTWRRISQAPRNQLQQNISSSQVFVANTSITEGDVVVLAGVAGRVGTTTTTTLTTTIGVALNGAAIAGEVEVALAGSVVQVRKTATAWTQGARVGLSTSAGQAAANATAGAIVGKAIEPAALNTTVGWIVVAPA